MTDSWRTATVDEVKASSRHAIAMGPFGSDITTDNFVLSGVPVVRGVNLNSGRFHDSDFVFVTDQKADELIAANAFPCDLVFTHRGTLGQVGIIPRDAQFPRYVVSQSQMKVSVNPEVVDPLFLYYFFKSPKGQHELLANTSTTGVPAISRPLSSLRAIQVPIPHLSEQHAIAHILGTLDDKIELNRRMNETLEAMARALFKSWFVDFDPVRAKAEGQQPLGMDAETAALFPDGFDESELVQVPRGWKLGRLGDIIELLGGGTPKTTVAEYWDGDIPWFSVVDAPRDCDLFVVTTEKAITRTGLENSSARLLPSGTTIISARGTVGKCAIAAVPMAMNQSCYGVRGRDGRGDYYTYFTVRHSVADLKRGSHGSVFDTITRATFDSVTLIRPPIHITQAFDRAVGPWCEQILANLRESLTLTAIRDALLPKLLSRDIRVKEAEKVVEEVMA